MQDDNLQAWVPVPPPWAWAPPPPPPPPWWATPPPPPWATAPQEEEVVSPIWSFWRDDTFHSNIKLPTHETTVDDQLFLRLLAWSISLSIDEKKKIVENFWSLSQYQVDELIKIFQEEKDKFSALDEKHKKQLRTLEKQHSAAWDAWELEVEQWSEAEVEEDEAEDIRKSLGL